MFHALMGRFQLELFLLPIFHHRLTYKLSSFPVGLSSLSCRVNTTCKWDDEGKIDNKNNSICKIMLVLKVFSLHTFIKQICSASCFKEEDPPSSSIPSPSFFFQAIIQFFKSQPVNCGCALM